MNNFLTDLFDGTLKGTAILSQSELESNGNTGVLHTLQNSKTGASSLNAV